MSEIKVPTDPFAVERKRFDDTFRTQAFAVAPGQRIILEGEPVQAYIWMAGGWISLSKDLRDGKSHIIDIGLPRDLIAITGPDGRHAAFDIEALTESQVALLGMPDIKSWRNGSPSAARMLERSQAFADIRRAERMLRIAHGSAMMRVAYVLVELHLRIDALDHLDLNTFHIPLRQRHIGDLVGLTSEHVSRTFRSLAEKGLVSFSDHFDIRINDLVRLCEVADVDFDALQRMIALPAR